MVLGILIKNIKSQGMFPGFLLPCYYFSISKETSGRPIIGQGSCPYDTFYAFCNWPGTSFSHARIGGGEARAYGIDEDIWVLSGGFDSEAIEG